MTENEIIALKKKSDRRKRHLRDLNKKMELYIALIDASLSDAARYKAEMELWKDRYFYLLNEQK